MEEAAPKDAPSSSTEKSFLITCSLCNAISSNTDSHYHCSECDWWDVCDKCFQKHPLHKTKHHVFEEKGHVHENQLKVPDSCSAATISNAFKYIF